MTILCRKMIEWLSKPSMYPWFLVTDRQNECIYKDASSFNTKYKLLSMLVNIRNLFPIFFEVKSVNHTLLHGIEGLFNPSPLPIPTCWLFFSKFCINWGLQLSANDFQAYSKSIIKILNLYFILLCIHFYHYFLVSIHKLQYFLSVISI